MTWLRLVLAAGCLCALCTVPPAAFAFGGGDTLCKKICSHSLLSSLNKSNTVQCWIDCRARIEADARAVAGELCQKRYTSGTEREACRTAIRELQHYLVNGELSPDAMK